MSDDTSAALGRIKAALDYKHRHVQLTEAQAREALAHIAALEARAKEAEAKVAAAEERGLVFNTLPDGRLDFCAIRAGSRLWDGRVRAEALTAEVARLREAVTWLLNCHRGLNRHGHGVGGDDYWGNIDAATAFAREALAAAPAAPEKPSGESGWLPADPPAAWIEAMADSVVDTLCGQFGVYDLNILYAADVARAALIALARKMEGRDAE